MINEQRLLDEFLHMVQIDSETKHERKIVDYLMGVLQEQGFQVIEDDVHKKADVEAGNVIITVSGNRPQAKRLLFTAHVDTVTPGNGIVPELRDGYVYSKGDTILGGDDKAGVAAILEMLRVLREKQMDHGDIQVVLTVGEESGLLGAKNMDSSILAADMGIALDSNGDVGTVIIQGPVQYSLKATFTGKAAHAGVNPEAGISAIEVAADAINGMKLGRIDEETTANIGIIQGGQATNIVCETVHIKGEARSLNRQKVLTQVEHMKHELHRAATARQATVEFEFQEEYPEFCFTPEDVEVKLVKKAMESLGVPCVCQGSGGGSDASIFNGYGIPTLNLGIGMEKIHSTEERIALDQLYKTSKLLIEIVKIASTEQM